MVLMFYIDTFYNLSSTQLGGILLYNKTSLNCAVMLICKASIVERASSN